MTTLIINTKKQGNAKFIFELVKKLGETGEIVSAEIQEDVLLGLVMNEEKQVKKFLETLFLRN